MEEQLLYSNHYEEYTRNKAHHQLSINDQIRSMDKMKSIIKLAEGTDGHTQCNDTKRTGKLCQKCKGNYSLAIGSNECIDNSRCSNIYLLLLIFFVAAGFLLVFFIKILNMTVSQGTINGLIFYANIVWAYQSIFFPDDSHPAFDKEKYFIFLKVFMAWLNLDFGIETCFFRGLNFYWKTWLQFVFPLYVWAIALLIIVVSRYSQRMTRVFGNNSVQVLATLLLLSHAKLLRTIISATLPYKSHNRTQILWAFDGDIVYYRGAKHGILFGTAILVFVFLWLPYTLTLLLIQPLRRCPYFRLCRLKLMPFFDAYTGPFCTQSHFWVGLLCLVRGILLLVYALTYFANNESGSTLALVITVMLLFLVLYSSGRLYNEPTHLMDYKVSFLSILEISFLLNLAVLGFGVLCINHIFPSSDDPTAKLAAIVYSSVGVAFLQFIGIFCWHIWKVIVSCCIRRARDHYQDMEANVDTRNVTATSMVIGDSPVLDNSAHIRESILTDGSRAPNS